MNTEHRPYHRATAVVDRINMNDVKGFSLDYKTHIASKCNTFPIKIITIRFTIAKTLSIAQSPIDFYSFVDMSFITRFIKPLYNLIPHLLKRFQKQHDFAGSLRTFDYDHLSVMKVRTREIHNHLSVHGDRKTRRSKLYFLSNNEM